MHSSAFPSGFSSASCWSSMARLIFGYGLYEWATWHYPAGVQLTHLHTPVWWGACSFWSELFYIIKFRPGRQSM